MNEEVKEVETEEEKKVGVKEVSELLEGLEKLAKFGVKVLEDGVVNVKDIGALVALSKDLEVLVDAFEGLGSIDDELKDLDQEEIIMIVIKVFGIIKSVGKAKRVNVGQ